MILHEFIGYDLLRVIWWALLGVLLIGFALTDGFDMGVGTLLPFIARTDAERRVVINTVGPVWEGNQVWFILGGGSIFAAWPLLYAISFSGFYLAMFAILAALILRPVAFKYRSERDSPRWRGGWDWALFTGSAVPALLFGIAVGNALLGIGFSLTPALDVHFDAAFLARFRALLHPFALLVGLVSLSMLVTHGAAWLVLRTEGVLAARARRVGTVSGLVTMAGYALAGLWLGLGIEGYVLTGVPAADAPSNPLYTTVLRQGSWLAAYAVRPWIAVAPALGFLGMAMAWRGMRRGGGASTLLWSKLGIFGAISSVGLTMFPFILPSASDPDSSLTVWDSSSSHATLFIMLVAVVIFLPLILAYTAWVYRVIWGKVTEDSVSGPDGGY